MLGGNHGTKAITTYPFGPRVYYKLGGGYMGAPHWNVNIVVEDDVWIGYDALKDLFIDDWYTEINEENVDHIMAHFMA